MSLAVARCVVSIPIATVLHENRCCNGTFGIRTFCDCLDVHPYEFLDGMRMLTLDSMMMI